MTRACDIITEEMWEQGISRLVGKQDGYRVMVWSNYDIISTCKVFFVAEKEARGCGRLTLRDVPFPVFWDEITPVASERIAKLNKAIDTTTFDEFPMLCQEYEDYGGWVDDLDENAVEREEEDFESEEESEDAVENDFESEEVFEREDSVD